MKLLAMEFTGEYIHILQVNTKGNNTSVEKIFHIPMPQNCYMNGMLINNDRSVSDVIVEKLKEEKIREKQVIVSVSGNDCLNEEFSVPNDKKIKIIDGMVEQELQKRRKLSNNYIYDYVIIGPDPLQEGYIKVKAVLCPKALIGNYYDVIRKCGLEPYKMDLINHSMEFLAEKSCLSTAQEISILACLNKDDLHFLYCGRNEEPYYRHAAITKEDTLDESMFVLSASSKFNLGLDNKENLTETVIENLTKLTRFHSQRHPDLKISAVYVYGDCEDIPTICDRITNALGIQARTYNPVSSINHLTKRSVDQLTGSISVLGSVLAINDSRTKNFGFFEEYTETKEEKGGNLFWAPTMISILLVAALVVVTQIYNVKNKQLQSQIDEEEEYLEDSFNMQAYSTIEGYLDEIDSRYQYNERAVKYMEVFQATNRLDQDTYLLIDSMVTDDVTVNSVNYSSGVITINCTGNTQYTPSNFSERLSTSDQFENVAYTGFVSRSSGSDEDMLYDFTVTMNLSQKALNELLAKYQAEADEEAAAAEADAETDDTETEEE